MMPKEGSVWYYNVEDDIIESATWGSHVNTLDAARSVISEAGLVGMTASWIRIISDITKENIMGRIDPM